MTTSIMPASPASRAAALARPGRDIRHGAIIAAAFFVLFLGWAAIARLDAAVQAPGVLVVSGERQVVQHRDGGVIGRIVVHEGSRVRRSDVLVTLSAPEVVAQERALQAQWIQLMAQRARLQAEQTGAPGIVALPEFAALSSADARDAQAALQRQAEELRQRRGVLAAQRETLRQRVAQSGAQGGGYSRQEQATQEQVRLIDEQLRAMAPLAEKGFVSKSRMRELERAKAALIGQQGEYAADVARSRGAASESLSQSIETQRSFEERALSELRSVETDLGELVPKLAAAREQLARTQIRAPASGSVVALKVFTPGGVIQPGQTVMEIVPDREPLRMEIRIAPNDVDDLATGMAAQVRFPGLHDRRLPALEGKVTRISADSLQDERTGTRYFTGEVTVPASELAILREFRGSGFALRAGMPMEALIPLRKRTALDYALEPLGNSLWGSFGEH